uniref:7-dehydrocholesterol reductase n=1 Tax=Caenorhabditis japonica TaxID=281687 RepID=A0A8R1I6Z2_CAEJA
MKELNRVRRSSFGGSASSLARRSSISQKDIIALQETLQKQQKLSSQVVLLLIVTVPPVTFLIFYSISIHSGLFMPTITALFFRWPFVFQCLPSLWDTIAWKFSIVHCALQLIFYWFLPHDQALVMSSAGDQLREINSFFSCVLTCLLYVLGATVGFYRGDLIYTHFNSIVAIFALFSVLTMAFLILSYHLGTGNSDSLLCLSLTQILYISHFHWSEDLYLNSLDSKRSSCGFYRLWADFVLAPVIYTAPITVISHYHLGTVGLISNCIFSTIAVASIIFTAKCDRQKYDFRKTKGDFKMGGVDAFFISAKYKTESGEPNINLLLGSGHWGVCRHPNYTSEALTFVAFSAFQGFPSIFAHFPAFFVIGFLIARAYTDENRCLIKYGQFWAQYCSKVKYRFFPGVF